MFHFALRFPKKYIANGKTTLFLSLVRAAWIFKYLTPVLFWMILIFGGSTGLGASRNTSRIIGPILRWLNPNMSEATVGQLTFAIRKCGHAVEFGILALLVWRALRHRRVLSARGWSWPDAGLAVLISCVYAASDEFHQSFVLTREGSGWDVMIDTAGAVSAIFLLWKIGGWLKRW